MKFLFFLLGVGITFKTGPFVLAGMVSPSDLALVAAISLFVMQIFSEQFRNGAARITSMNQTYFLICIALWMTALMHLLAHGLAKPDLSHFITLSLIFFASFSLYEVNAHNRTALLSKECVHSYFVGVLVGLITPYVFSELGLISIQKVYFFPGGRYKALLNHQNNVGVISSFLVSYFIFAPIGPAKKFLFLTATMVPLFLCTSKFNLALSAFLIYSYVVFKIMPVSFGVKVLIWGGAIVSLIPLQSVIFDLGVKLLIRINPAGAFRIIAFAENPSEASTWTERFHMWQNALQYGTEALPFGVGVSRVPTFLDGFTHAHNAILNSFLVFGIPGVVHIFGLVFLCIITMRSSIRENSVAFAPACAVLIGIIASNMSDSFSNLSAQICYLAIAIALGAVKRERSSEMP